MAASVLCLLSWGKNERRYQIINEADPCVGYKQLGKVCYTKGQGTIFYFLHRTSKRVVFSCLFIFFNIFFNMGVKNAMQCSNMGQFSLCAGSKARDCKLFLF